MHAYGPALLFLLTTSILHGSESIDVLVPGLSHHSDWNSPDRPREVNYGLGLSYTFTRPEEGDWGQLQIGGLAYRDSFDRRAHVGFAGLGLRTPTVICAEILAGLGYWSGSGSDGVWGMWYVGVGYQTQAVPVFLDGTTYDNVSCVWLKFSVSLNN